MAFTDTFDRADSADLGADWSAIPSNDPFKIASNVVTFTAAGNDAAEVYTSGSFANDQYSQAVCTFVTASTGSGVGMGLCVRGSTGANTYYRVVVAGAGAGNVEISKHVAGAFSSLGTITQTFSASDVLKLEVTGAGAAIVLKVYRNGAQIGGDIADSSGSHIDSGRPGIAYSSAVGDTPTLNNWEGGDIAATPQTQWASPPTFDYEWSRGN